VKRKGKRRVVEKEMRVAASFPSKGVRNKSSSVGFGE